MHAPSSRWGLIEDLRPRNPLLQGKARREKASKGIVMMKRAMATAKCHTTPSLAITSRPKNKALQYATRRAQSPPVGTNTASFNAHAPSMSHWPRCFPLPLLVSGLSSLSLACLLVLVAVRLVDRYGPRRSTPSKTPPHPTHPKSITLPVVAARTSYRGPPFPRSWVAAGYVAATVSHDAHVARCLWARLLRQTIARVCWSEGLSLGGCGCDLV